LHGIEAPELPVFRYPVSPGPVRLYRIIIVNFHGLDDAGQFTSHFNFVGGLNVACGGNGYRKVAFFRGPGFILNGVGAFTCSPPDDSQCDNQHDQSPEHPSFQMLSPFWSRIQSDGFCNIGTMFPVFVFHLIAPVWSAIFIKRCPSAAKGFVKTYQVGGDITVASGKLVLKRQKRPLRIQNTIEINQSGIKTIL
jgi:hypothetical protein